ncbi:MAG: DUF2752 domain-containing protein [Polyangiaceae bacterium]|nr:DUF2752 domain-containing protein [Polyangiaceae bacterium]
MELTATPPTEARTSYLDAHPRVGRVLRLCAFVVPLAIASSLGISTCPVALLTGAPCPGCGMTRAALALARGDIALATAMNPSALLTVPLSAGLVAFFTLSYLYDGRMRANARIPRALAIGTIILLTCVSIARAFGAFGGPVSV